MDFEGEPKVGDDDEEEEEEADEEIDNGEEVRKSFRTDFRRQSPNDGKKSSAEAIASLDFST
jgi:hypothetical protein